MLLNRPAWRVRQTARTIAAAGADRVRLTAGWSAIAPAPRSRRQPGAPFVATDPSTYPRGAWEPLDTAVTAARDAGLRVMLDIGFWAPRWAVRRPSANPNRQRYAPNPAQFADFATAVARRYGHAVDIFTTWNEPNHPSFLTPQYKRGRPRSPHVYRAMHEAAYVAIKHERPNALVLLGNTAATGGGGVAPLRFVRTMACVDERLEPLNVPECAGYRPIHADGFAHHPYSRATDPASPAAESDDAPLGDVKRLEGLLHALAERGRIARPLPLYVTEYGYESRPDDPFAPFDRDEQATWLSKAAFLAWKDPGTAMFAQFLLRDVDPGESGRQPGTRGFYRDFQTGLYAADGNAKPALQAFKLPFWIERHETASGPVLVAWGMVRPGRGRQPVRVEQRGDDGVWRAVRVSGPDCSDSGMEFLTDASGAFVAAATAAGPPLYRLSWRRSDGVWEAGVPVPVSAPSA